MVIDGKVIGKPIIEYYGTQAQIEALTDVRLGMLAYATDINKIGYYNGSIWTWIDPVGGGAAAGTTGDIQYNNAGEFAADTGEFTYDPTGLNAKGLMKVYAIQSPSIDNVDAYLQLGGDTKSVGHGNDIYFFGGDTTAAGANGGDAYIIVGAGGAGGTFGRVKILSADPNTTNYLVLNTDALTSVDRTITFPDKSGTVAYLSDLIASGIDSNAIHTNQPNEISGITEKVTVSGSDWFVLEDSQASYVKKKIKYINLVPSGIVTKLGATVAGHVAVWDSDSNLLKDGGTITTGSIDILQTQVFN